MSETQATIRTCDQCGKRAERQDEPRQMGGLPFVGWHTITTTPPLMDGVPRTNHLCSYRCGMLWFEGEVAAEAAGHGE